MRFFLHIDHPRSMQRQRIALLLLHYNTGTASSNNIGVGSPMHVTARVAVMSLSFYFQKFWASMPRR